MRWLVAAMCLTACTPRGRVVVSAAAPQPFCTRTLGVAECFYDPADLPDHPRELVDTPVRAHVACVSWRQEGGLACLLEQQPRP